LRDVKLHDYKVRVLDGKEGTAGLVRVLIESGDSEARWGTVGVSHNVVEASWQALVDSILYKLHKDRRGRKAESRA
jgi:2-isopropylmalate synthase